MENKNELLVNRFELKSRDMQEVMKKPPHKFIFWGTMWVLVFLVFIFCVLNQFYVSDKIVHQAKVLQIVPVSDSNNSFVLQLSTDIATEKESLIHKDAEIQIFNGKTSPVYSINGKVDSVTYTNYEEPYLYVSAKTDRSIKEGMIGTVEIEMDRKTYLVKLLENTFRK